MEATNEKQPEIKATITPSKEGITIEQKKQDWEKEQHWESDWWGSGVNSFGEEKKQMEYAKRMGIPIVHKDGHICVDAQNKSIIDVGGGVVSLLLKAINLNSGIVVEPMKLPGWVLYRYVTANLGVIRASGEEFTIPSDTVFDEIWIYNVLQHTYDPKAIIENCQKYSKIIRIFDWLDTPPHPGHPQTLKKELLDEWLGGVGRDEFVNENEWNGYGHCYYGVFPTKNYEGKLDQ